MTRTLKPLPNTSQTEKPIESKFEKLHSLGEGALIAYLTGGDPDRKSFLDNATALVDGGADILEVGIPFSDPIADGRVIQASSQRALLAGATPQGILELIKEFSSTRDVPVVVLTYYNIVLAGGLDRFLETSQKSGVSGLVVPDLPVEESDRFREASSEHSVDTIFLAAPNTSETRMKQVIDKSHGFVYLVSLFGVTGPRKVLNPTALSSVKRVKTLAKGKIPIAAGFGISKPEHVSELIAAGADGAIVGSALVEIVAQNLGNREDARLRLKNVASELKKATKPNR